MSEDKMEKLVADGKIEEPTHIINEFGEPEIPIIYQYKLTAKGKKEVNEAVNTLKQYNIYVEPDEFTKTREKYIRVKDRFTKIRTTIEVSTALSIFWYIGFIYSLFFDKGKIMIFIFPTLILAILIYILVAKKEEKPK
jgi:hypothetical protein